MTNEWLSNCLDGTSSGRSLIQIQFNKTLDVTNNRWYSLDAAEDWTPDNSAEVTSAKGSDGIRMQESISAFTEKLNITIKDDNNEEFNKRYIHEQNVSDANFIQMCNGNFNVRLITFHELGLFTIKQWNCCTLTSVNGLGVRKGSAEAVEEMAFTMNAEPVVYNVAIAPNLPSGVTEVKATVSEVATSGSITVETTNILDPASLIASKKLLVTLTGKDTDGNYIAQFRHVTYTSLTTGGSTMFAQLKSGEYAVSVAYDAGDNDYRGIYTSSALITI